MANLRALLPFVTKDVPLDADRLATSARGLAPLVAHGAGEGRIELVVVTNSQEASDLEDDLTAWLGSEAVANWPAWDVAPFERVSPDISQMGRRLELRHRLQHQPPLVIVATVRSLLQVVPPLAQSREVQTGSDCDRNELVRWLVTHGYRREPQVEHRGEIAVRGDIVDVWLSHLDEPVRIELFGDTVERIAHFDVSTQRSLGTSERLVVLPAREWTPNESERERAREVAGRSELFAELFDPIAEGLYADGMESWFGWLSGSSNTLIDVIGDNVDLVLVDAEALEARARDLLTEERELANVVGDTWGLDEAPLLHLNFDEVLSRAESQRHISRHGVDSPSWNVTDPPVVQGDMGRLATQLDVRRPEWAAVVVAQEATRDRLAQAASDEGLAVSSDLSELSEVDLVVLTGHLPRGVASDSFILWSESDLTGRRVVRRSARARSRHVDGFFDDLAIGAYVVHRLIGVARYSGSTTRTIGETTRDYLILEFRGNDRLFLPTDQIDLLTPYTGGGTPQLSRMGGAEWQKTTARARAEAREIADELLELYRLRAAAPGHAFSPDTQWQVEMENLFPFTETPDQRRAIEDVKADMEAPRPMDRLVCADVGFGKTEVAIRALFKAVQDGKQAAFLAPTTLLVSQHFQTVVERFASFPIKVAMLSRFVEDAEAAQTLGGLRDGTVDVVVGTHRLLGESVRFANLGLLVVDEEQRFGVVHKDAIKRLSVGVDVLTLTASPIPRTLEMALTGIRDLSMVTTPPVDRQPILTHVGEFDESAIVEAVRRELLREGQVFYVHNRVADIDLVQERLSELVPEARIAVAHAQMDEGMLERIVQDFFERKYDVLLCTTIVESGIDIPNVNTLIVDRADLLGLGQLHQLRGRVGRGGARAYAYLFYPRGVALSDTAFERLRCIGDNTALGSGFKIAMRDLEIRGAGSLLGHRQSGQVSAVGYDLYVQLVAEAVTEAKGGVSTTPPTVVLPRLGIAHIPEDYIVAEDQRLEAYRRLTAALSDEELEDVAAEWRDRYGSLPDPARGLIDVMGLRVDALQRGIAEIATQQDGDRFYVSVRLHTMDEDTYSRLARKVGERAIDRTTGTVSLWLEGRVTTIPPVRELISEVFEPAG